MRNSNTKPAFYMSKSDWSSINTGKELGEQKKEKKKEIQKEMEFSVLSEKLKPIKAFR